MTKKFTRYGHDTESGITPIIFSQPSKEAMLLIEKIITFDTKYPTALEPEMLDFLDIIEFGKQKHPDPTTGSRANWLQPNGNTSSHKDMHDRVFHHLARSFADPFGVDSEFPRDHALFAICRLTMLYIRRRRGLIHKEDTHIVDLAKITNLDDLADWRKDNDI